MRTSQRFKLDRDGATDVIADVWGLAIGEPGSWRLDRFGPNLASSIENLATVVFSQHRHLVRGPDAEVRVLPIVEPDPHIVPAVICVDKGTGPMLSVGIESLPDVLPDPWGCSPETVLNALQRLLDIASDICAGSSVDRPVPAFSPQPATAGGVSARQGYPAAGTPYPIG